MDKILSKTYKWCSMMINRAIFSYKPKKKEPSEWVIMKPDDVDKSEGEYVK